MNTPFKLKSGNKPEKSKFFGVKNNLNRAQMEIGSLETRKHAMLDHVVSFQGELSKMQEELKKEYGTDNINIHTGEINYDEQAN